MGNLPIFEYFWLTVAVFVGAGGAIALKINYLKQIAAGNITAKETNTLIMWWLIWIIGPSIAFWYLQSSSGSPYQIDFMTWDSNNKYFAISLSVILWASLLVWVFNYGGAKVLIRLCKLSNSRHTTLKIAPWHIKVLAALTVFCGFLALFVPRS